MANKEISLYHFARKLTGANCNSIKARLAELGYLYKTKYTPYKVYSDFRGVYFDEKIVDGKNDIIVMNKGKKLLTQLYRKGQLDLRKGRHTA